MTPNGNRTCEPPRAPKKAELCSINNCNDLPYYSILKINHRVFQHANNTRANMKPDTSSTYWGKNDLLVVSKQSVQTARHALIATLNGLISYRPVDFSKK